MKKIIVLILIVFSFQACRSKKKIVERTNQKIEHALQEQKETSAEIKTQKDSSVNIKSETITIAKTDEIDLTQADPFKTIIIEDQDGKKLIITGANVSIKSKEKSEIKTDTIASSTTLDQTEKATTSEKKNESTTIDKKTRSTNAEITGTATWLWILLIILIVLFLVYLYFKRRSIFSLLK